MARQWHQKLARTPQGPCTTCRHGRQSMNPKTRQYPPKTLRDGPGILQSYRPKTFQEFINVPSKDCHDSPKDFPRLGQFPKAVFRDCPQECSRSLHDFPRPWPKNSPGLPPGIRKDHTRAVHDFPGNGPRIGPGIGPDPWPSFSTISLRIPEGNRSRLPPRFSKILQGLCKHSPSSSPRIPPRSCQGPRGTLHDFRRQSPKCVHKACPRSPKNLVRFPKGFPKTIAQYRLQELTNTPQNP